MILVCLGGVASVARAQLDIVDTEPGQFIDISLTGQRIVLGDDEELENFPVPFGNTVLPGGTVVVANNGGLAFGTIFDPNLDPINQPIANNAAFGGSQSLVAYWDDIGNHIGDIFFEDLGDRYIFQWHRKPLSGVPTTTVTFQVQVFANVLAAPIYAQFIYTDIEGEGAEGASAPRSATRTARPRSTTWSGASTPNSPCRTARCSRSFPSRPRFCCWRPAGCC